jgi:hypothetical protein
MLRLLDHGLTDRLAAAADLAQQATNDPESALDLLAEWRRWWEGVLLAKGGLPVSDERQQTTASRLSWPAVLAALRAIDTTREHWERNVNPLLAFEHLTLSMPAMA